MPFFLRFLQHRILFDTPTGAGGGNPAPPPATPPAVPPATPPAPPATPPGAPAGTPDESFRNRLKKYEGDGLAFATDLYNENYQLRERTRQAEERARQYEGKTVLSAEDLQRYQAYQGLGSVDVLKTQIGELGALKRDKALADVAQAAGYNLDALKQLGGGLDYEVKSVQVQKDGKTQEVKQAYVKVKEGDAVKEIPLDTFAEANWKPFLPVLKAQPQRGGTPGGTPGVTPVQQQSGPAGGTPWVQQPTNPQPAGDDDPVAGFIKTRNEAGAKAANPLAKK